MGKFKQGDGVIVIKNYGGQQGNEHTVPIGTKGIVSKTVSITRYFHNVTVQLDYKKSNGDWFIEEFEERELALDTELSRILYV